MAEATDDKFSYEQLEEMLERTREERNEARRRSEEYKAVSDQNYASGQEWKTTANERSKRIEALEQHNRNLTEEAAELRGYVRRVHELDPEDVQQRRGPVMSVDRHSDFRNMSLR